MIITDDWTFVQIPKGQHLDYIKFAYLNTLTLVKYDDWFVTKLDAQHKCVELHFLIYTTKTYEIGVRISNGEHAM